MTSSSRKIQLGKLGWASVGVIVFFVTVALFAPIISPYPPTGGSILDQLQPPSFQHLLGTDVDGNDILSRLIHGARPSLLGPVLVVTLSLLVGVPLALISAWKGGWLDQMVGRALDLIFAFPTVLLAGFIILVFGRGLTSAIIAVSIAYIPYTARIARATALRERNKPYIIACEVQGLSTFKIFSRHLLPNMSRFLAAQATIAFGFALVDLAALSFIGIGILPPNPDWGVMVGDTTSLVQGSYTSIIAAACCILAIVASFTILGNRLSEKSVKQ
jgi:peptide/nickel transport system permease protein